MHALAVPEDVRPVHNFLGGGGGKERANEIACGLEGGSLYHGIVI